MFCSKCGAENADDSKFCGSCGSPCELNPVVEEKGEEKKSAPAFSTANDSPKTNEGSDLAFRKIGESSGGKQVESPEKKNEAPDPQDVRVAEMCPAFAEGLPSWDLVPPHVMVVRGRNR